LGEILGRAAGIPSVKYDQVMTSPRMPRMVQKVWVKGSKMRAEMTAQGQSVVTIVNLDTQTTYMYIPAQNMAIRADLRQGQGPRSTMSVSATEWSKLILTDPKTAVVGTETIDGKVCLLVEGADEEGKGLKTWIWQEYGFPIRMEWPIAEGKLIMEWKNIEFVNIPDSMFELPSGVQITEPK
jgi:hypothetical protein